MAIELRNPHSVQAALERRPNAVMEIRLHSRQPGTAWESVAETAKAARVPVRRGQRPEQSGRRQPKGDQSERIGAGSATVKELDPVELDEIFANGAERANGRGVWLALDQVQDPRNLGAIFRSAAFFGLEGLIFTRHKSAPLTGVAYDAASGGIEHVPYANPPSLTRTMQLAKDNGLWILGASEHAEQDISEVDRERPWLLIVGNEQQGLRRLTQKNCDTMCRLSPRGPVQSLNVSVATAVLLAGLTR